MEISGHLHTPAALTLGLDSQQGMENFHHNFQTGYGAHLASHPVGYGSPCTGINRTGPEAYCHLQIVPKIRMRGSIILLPNITSWLGI
jgi:hypothetical protein